MIKKNRAHFFRMNPQTIQSPRPALTPTLVAVLLLVTSLVALYWLGTLDGAP